MDKSTKYGIDLDLIIRGLIADLGIKSTSRFGRPSVGCRDRKIPGIYVIGDGVSWNSQVQADVDTMRRKSALQELRDVVDLKLKRYDERVSNADVSRLCRDLRVMVAGSDEALIKVANLVGMRPSQGLWEAMATIAKEHDQDASGRPNTR